ncbi:torso-like protein [Copidosoma floridanum]|uniref:torso-like protein n=1 Tax=Copidosoma floridanum TaxID=29053 RepID=UPI0006C970A9|nr:torso-like protein [Copidosoma floridanum]
MWTGRRPLVLLVLLLLRLQLTLQQRPKLGGSVNVFSRYGYLAVSMRVVPRNDSDTWIFREPSLDVFRNVAPAPPKARRDDVLFDGDYHLEFCDNVRQLLQAYFRDFTFEHLERPWRAFTGSWSRAMIAKHLGISASFVTGDHCYVLVRVSRFRDVKRLNTGPGSEYLHLDEDVAREAENVTIGDTASVIRFIKNFGSHYISSYVTGNSLYQVFVYSPQTYLQIKRQLKSRGVAELSSIELNNFFSPWNAEHMGAILSASGNRTVEYWAAERLRVHLYIFTYASLLKLHGNGELLAQLDSLLGDEALLQLQLRTLTPLFQDPKRRQWFLNVIDNYFKLWEVNI